MHWTQDPKNKKRLSEIRKKSHAIKRKAQQDAAKANAKPKPTAKPKSSNPNSKTNALTQEAHIVFAFGYVQAFITEHSRRTGVSQFVLASRLAEFLLVSTVR